MVSNSAGGTHGNLMMPALLAYAAEATDPATRYLPTRSAWNSILGNATFYNSRLVI